MTEDEKKIIRASFAGKRVSQMTALERKVFDEDFEYGVVARSSKKAVGVTSVDNKKSTMASIWKRLGLTKR